MARLNIYVPDDLHSLADRWRERVNLSEICATALREELEALDAYRVVPTVIQALAPPSDAEIRLRDQYSLADVIIVETPTRASDLRDTLGRMAATYIDRQLCDGSYLAFSGGRQMWCVVRSLAPRSIRLRISALGIRQTDPQVLNAHPNTLVTLLWLLYAPRSTAHLVGSRTGMETPEKLPPSSHVRYIVVSSCAPFTPASPFGSLLGSRVCSALEEQGTLGDFAYTFISREGSLVTAPPMEDHTILQASSLKRLSQRPDARVVLVAGGEEKLPMISATLKTGLCNALVTDRESARTLLDTEVDA